MAKSKSKNNKIEGKKHSEMSTMDCYVYYTICDNCKEKVSGWSPQEADANWEKHTC